MSLQILSASASLTMSLLQSTSLSFWLITKFFCGWLAITVANIFAMPLLLAAAAHTPRHNIVVVPGRVRDVHPLRATSGVDVLLAPPVRLDIDYYRRTLLGNAPTLDRRARNGVSIAPRGSIGTSTTTARGSQDRLLLIELRLKKFNFGCKHHKLRLARIKFIVFFGGNHVGICTCCEQQT